TEVKRGQIGDVAAKAAVLDSLVRGPKLAGYSGHASVDLWRANLLTDSDAAQLSNSDHLSMFVMMNCLNGYFIDPRVDSLGAALLTAKGGAAAVWASSAMTLPENQIEMTREFFRQVWASGQIRVGDAILKAKAVSVDPDVRRSWILLGDPTMRLR